MRRKIFGSIRGRLVLTYLAVTVAALIAIITTVSGRIEDFVVSQRTQGQLQETTRLALELAPAISSNDADSLYNTIYERAQTMGGRVLVMDTSAVVQADSASQQIGYRLPYREVRDVLVSGLESSHGFHRIIRDQETSGLLLNTEKTVWAVYYTAPITLEGQYIGCVLFSVQIQDVEDSIQEVIEQIAVVFVIVAALMVFISLALSGWLTKPIIALTNTIRRMGKDGYGERVEVKRGDVEELAELGKAFNRMSEQIEAHDRVRDEFVSNASHELKTPLSTMKILSESIIYDESPDPALMKEFFMDVNHEVDRLSRIITELLRLVKDDADSDELQRETVRLDKLVEGVGERLMPLAEKKSIMLTIKSEPVTLLTDPLKLEQLAINLIENAIKYTDEGNVLATVTQDGDDAVLMVSDSGIGIPKEAIPHLFERFYRVDKARSRGTGGTGLGLSIVDKIVTRFGGSIDVTSEPGVGSTFTVRLPMNGGADK